MFDKIINIDLMLIPEVPSFTLRNFFFKMNLNSCKPTSPFWMFLIRSSPPTKVAPFSIAISQSRFSFENTIIVRRYSLWSNACGIDTIFGKLSLNFVYIFFSKKIKKINFLKNMDLNLKSRLNDLNKFENFWENFSPLRFPNFQSFNQTAAATKNIVSEKTAIRKKKPLIATHASYTWPFLNPVCNGTVQIHGFAENSNHDGAKSIRIGSWETAKKLGSQTH